MEKKTDNKKQLIYIDVSIIRQTLFLTGIQRVVKEIILQLVKYVDLEIIFLDYDEKKRAFATVPTVEFLNYLRRGRVKKNAVFHRGHVQSKRRFILPEQLEKGSVFFDLDAVWMCKIKRSYLYPILKRNGISVVVHVYDIICITHPQFFEDLLVMKFMDYLGAAMQYADRIICNADATKNDLMELSKAMGDISVIHPSQISVVPLGADFKERKTDEKMIPKAIRGAACDSKFILMVGTIEPRKNHALLLDAYDIGLKAQGYNIIFAGTPGWKNDDFMNRLTNHRDFGKRIFLFSKQPDYVIDYLYSKASYVAFLSYKEGYGLPIIESLAKGTPVIATDTPINKEIGGERCLFFEQNNPGEMCEVLASIDTVKYNQLRSGLTGYTYCSWKYSGRKMHRQLVLTTQ